MPDDAPKPAQWPLDAFTKLVSPLLAIATFAWGIYTYGVTAERENIRMQKATEQSEKTRLVEAQKPFLEKQLAYFIEATKAASTIATAANETDADAVTARVRFNQLYFGELAMVEQPGVASAMVNFKKAMDGGQKADLRMLALTLAHACRRELGAGWNAEALKTDARPDTSNN